MHNRKTIANRRAESTVISSVILVAAVIAVGFAVLIFSNSRSSIFAQEYSSAIDSDISKLNEGIAFENVLYVPAFNTLSIYFLNYGAAYDVHVFSVYLGNSSWHNTFSDLQVKYFNGTETLAFDYGEEGYIQLDSTILTTTLTSGTAYTVRITTERGSVFGKTFVA